MEAYKELLASKLEPEKHHDHKDKLLQTKLRDKEVKEAWKEERQMKKQEKEEERLGAAEANRFERAFHHNSKRYAKDEREEQLFVGARVIIHFIVVAIHNLHLQKHKREEHEKTGFMCEHGVWRCRICQPVNKHK